MGYAFANFRLAFSGRVAAGAGLAWVLPSLEKVPPSQVLHQVFPSVETPEPLHIVHCCGFFRDPSSGLLSVCGDSETCEEAAKRRKDSVGIDLPLAVLVAGEALIRGTVVAILRGEGYDAVGAKDGATAVECAQKIRPEIATMALTLGRC